MFMDYFGFLSWISGKKKTKSSKIWANYGVLRCGVGTPTQQRRPTPRRGQEEAWDQSRVRLRHDVAMLHRSVALFTAWEILVFFFFFAFPLLRGPVYWINEDPISV